MAKKRILLVDDSKSARFALRLLLQKHGYRVDMAESAEAALEVVKAQRPDAIFMDHMMPGMDGFEATERLKGNPATAHIPVVMCTSNDDPHYVEQAKNLGALGILPKPATPEKLAELLALLEQEIEAVRPALVPGHEAIPQPTPISTPAAAVATGDEIEVLIRKILPDLVQETLEPLLEKKILIRCQELTRELVDQSVSLAQESATRMVNAAAEGLRDEMLLAAREQTERLIAGSGREMVSELVGSQVAVEAGELHRELSARLDAFRAELPEDPAIDQAVKTVALKTAVIKAREVAIQTARDTAQGTAAETAEATAGKQLAEAMNEIDPRLRSLSKRVNLVTFILLLALAMVGAAAIYLFRG